MFSAVFDRAEKPLIHNITNYVTANDVANAELAVGGAPIMADSPEETHEITAIADALNLNLGTLNPQRLEAMMISGGVANKKGIPLLLDLVGAGASQFRKNAATEIIKRLSPSVIKGNISELCAMISGTGSRGVDAFGEGLADKKMLADFAKRSGAVIAATGREDIITDGKRIYVIKNGSEMMGKITGTGCMLSGIMAVMCARNKGNITEAVLLGALLSGIAGELAEARMLPEDRNGTFKVYLMDEFSKISIKEIEELGRYEID